jgi:hypothetical protein
MDISPPNVFLVDSTQPPLPSFLAERAAIIKVECLFVNSGHIRHKRHIKHKKSRGRLGCEGLFVPFVLMCLLWLEAEESLNRGQDTG